MRRLIESLNNAIEGFIYVLKTQRNMRIHFMLALFVVMLGVYMNLTFIEMVILCTIISLVLITEMINTTIELVIDLMKDTYHPVARMAKDIGAGAVLVAAVNSLIVGYLIFARHIPFHIEDTITRLKQSPWHVTLLVLILVAGMAVMGKVFFHRGKPLRGGMPSGHAALAFAVWTIIAFSTTNALIALLVFIMALFIAKSRISLGIHTVWEVISGALLGYFTAALIFQVLHL
jgi:diacylglycerol kinase (ATP)